MGSSLSIRKNFLEQNPLANQKLALSTSATCLQTSPHTHSFNLSERFCGDPLSLKRRSLDKYYSKPNVYIACYSRPHGPVATSRISFRDKSGSYFKRNVQNKGAANTSNVHRMLFSAYFENFRRTVGKAAKEIIVIGRECGQARIAQKMSNRLLEMKEQDKRVILEYCVNLYTQSSFLYRACHRDLGDYYSTGDEKLFHYIGLLNRYINLYGKSYTGIVYRGAMMNDEKLKLHLTHDIDTAWYSPTYLSTSKSRQVAEIYGNILIIINIQESVDHTEKAIDISQLSAIFDEEEVLLTPKYILFKEKPSAFDPILRKHIIYLTTTHSSVYLVVHSDTYDRRNTKQKRDHSPLSSTVGDHHLEEIRETDSCGENESNHIFCIDPDK